MSKYIIVWYEHGYYAMISMLCHDRIWMLWYDYVSVDMIDKKANLLNAIWILYEGTFSCVFYFC